MPTLLTLSIDFVLTYENFRVNLNCTLLIGMFLGRTYICYNGKVYIDSYCLGKYLLN